MRQRHSHRHLKDLLRLTSCLVLTLGLQLFISNSAVFASVTNTRADAWGTVEVASGGWLNNTGVPIYSNGSSVTYWNGYGCVAVSGATGDPNCPTGYVTTGEQYQCVEMVNRLYLTETWTNATWSGDGYQLYGNAPSDLVDEPQGSISYMTPGDVITLSNGSGNPGHAAVVNTVTQSSGSSYTIDTASQNTTAVYFDATLSSGTLTLPSGWINDGYTVTGVTHAPTPMMIIDGSGHAYSENFLGNNWTSQMNTTTVTAIAIGGSGRMMVMTSTGAVYAKDYPTESWTQEISSGAQAIAVGGTGTMMVIDSAGNVYAKQALNDSWTQEYGSGGAKAIAVGGNGVEMIIDSAGDAYSNTGFDTPWGNEVTGVKAISVGGNGEMMVINSANDVYAEAGPSSWTEEATGDIAIAAGGNGAQMIIDNSNDAYYTNSIGGSWTEELGNGSARAIAAGSNGRLMVIDSNGEAWAKDHPSDNWTSLTSAGGASAIAINEE